MQRSFLKWAGGKYNALPEILKIIPKEGDTLIEPFMGGATVALNTDYEDYILNDYNQDLINLCCWVSKRPKQVVELSKDLFVDKNNTKKQFHILREKYNKSLDKKERALLFLYLNRHCYNGLMRYNSSGQYNTSFGNYKSPMLPVDEIFNFSKKLKKARFVCGEFQSLRFNTRPGKIVTLYSDPPYLPKSKTASFASYTQLGFKRESHLLLDKKSVEWRNRVNSVWVSNHDVPLIGECYKNGAIAGEFMVRRTISCKERDPAKEIVLSY